MTGTVAIIGAGIVGVACAFELQRRGHQVTLFDRDEPVRGCSFGNAGIIATSECFPLITPKRALSFPAMLFDREAPAVVRTGNLARSLPWFLRAATTLTTARQQAIAAALGALNRPALTAWRQMLAGANRPELLIERGMIELARDPGTLDGLRRRAQTLAAFGLQVRMLSGADIRDLEPGLGAACLGGILHESTAHVTDPYAVGIALLDAFTAMGGRFERDEVRAIDRTDRPLRLIGRSGTVGCDRAIVCAGISSSELLHQFGVTVPITAERGYHLMLRDAAGALSRPVTFAAESCVATPLSGGLRLAGTVEFADPSARPDWRRAERLKAFAEFYFAAPLAAAASSSWLGSRPSLPDSLPAIGLLEADRRVAYAFGHQHLGLTQAAVTASIVSDIVRGHPPEIDVRPYRVERFRAFSHAGPEAGPGRVA